MTKEQFLNLDFKEKLNIWHNFSSLSRWDIYFYENDEMTINDLYNRHPYKLAHDIHYGQYDYNDSYFYYDDLGRLISFSDELTFRSIIDIDEMITWYNDTYIGE